MRHDIGVITSVPCTRIFEVVQAGPFQGPASEAVTAMLEESQPIFPDVMKIVRSHEADWKRLHFEDNPYLGVVRIAFPEAWGSQRARNSASF